jgi:hypothetical protein
VLLIGVVTDNHVLITGVVTDIHGRQCYDRGDGPSARRAVAVAASGALNEGQVLSSLVLVSAAKGASAGRLLSTPIPMAAAGGHRRERRSSSSPILVSLRGRAVLIWKGIYNLTYLYIVRLPGLGSKG